MTRQGFRLHLTDIEAGTWRTTFSHDTMSAAEAFAAGAAALGGCAGGGASGSEARGVTGPRPPAIVRHLFREPEN
jgi:hypothetical protein